MVETSRDADDVESFGDRPYNEVFAAIAHPRRRAVLRITDRVAPVRPAELATHLVADTTDRRLMEVERSDAERALVDLRHVHLPQLVEARLLARTDEGALEPTGHPVFHDPKFGEMIRTETDDWDAVLQALADKRRRVVLTTLYRADGPMDLTDLAVAVAEDVRVDLEESWTVENLLVDMHHTHLPNLAAAGLVEYDPDAETVAYHGHPAVAEEWLVAGPGDTPRAILSMADRSADIWTLEGRDDVTERGRALCEAADEELFMMFTVDGTVETACVRRIRDALDRGVDVYLGTQNKQLRDLVRENAPEVTIWEPQLDWLNLPPTREKVGRLIMADREEIMIGTIGETGPDGVPRETAITGAGEDNPLVMLLREMLGSRLDHLDAQSEDFLSELPL